MRGLYPCKSKVSIKTFGQFWLYRCFMNASLESMNCAAHDFELRAIVSGDGCFALRLQLTNARLDGGLIDADCRVMFVLNTQRVRDCDEEVFLVHLGVALDRLVLDALRHVAQLGEVLVS